jgi:mono/diheme cytochrome c family protein
MASRGQQGETGMKWLRIAALVVGGLLAVVLVLIAFIWWNGGRRVAKQYDVAAESIGVPADSAAIAEGGRLTRVFACVSCHGAELEGRVMIDGPNFARVIAPQLSPGPTSATTGYAPEDWVRAIRHGIANDGTAILIMPSLEYQSLADSDVGRMIAWARSLPPATNALPATEVRTIARMLIGAGMLPIEADQVDHSKRPPEPVREVGVDYGRYLAATCRVCHGPDLHGVADPNFGGPDITRDGATAGWTFDDFRTAMRSGRTPDGRQLDDERMPWTALGHLTDDELTSVWQYIQAAPATR